MQFDNGQQHYGNAGGGESREGPAHADYVEDAQDKRDDDQPFVDRRHDLVLVDSIAVIVRRPIGQ